MKNYTVTIRLTILVLLVTVSLYAQQNPPGLGFLPGTNLSMGADINLNGMVVGVSSAPGGGAFMWSADSGMVGLGSLGTQLSSRAFVSLEYGAELNTPEMILGLLLNSRGTVYVKNAILNPTQPELGLQGSGTLTVDSLGHRQVIGNATIGQLNRGEVALYNGRMSVGGNFVIGDVGLGKLHIDSLSLMICNQSVLAAEQVSQAHVTVRNGASPPNDSTVWHVLRDLDAGYSGTAVFEVEDGRRVTVDSSIGMGLFPTATCSTFISGASLLVVRGEADIGAFGRGYILLPHSGGQICADPQDAAGALKTRITTWTKTGENDDE